MIVEVIFWTQIASIIGFVVSLFVLYHILVTAKDATIELLHEKLSSLETQLEEARATGPDVVAQQYAKRVKTITEELERLSQDHDNNQSAISEKETLLTEARAELAALQTQIERAQELMSEFFCPYCKAPMVTRDHHSEMIEYKGRDVDVDHEFLAFECGLSITDSKETHPCRKAAGNPRAPNKALHAMNADVGLKEKMT